MKTYQLPKEFAEKWVEALRSGKYKKVTGKYCAGKKCFCSLGLGHHVDGCIPTNIGKSEWIFDDFSVILPASPSDSNQGGMYLAITNMNDNDGKSFPEIADWIEQNVEFI